MNIEYTVNKDNKTWDEIFNRVSEILDLVEKVDPDQEQSVIIHFEGEALDE